MKVTWVWWMNSFVLLCRAFRGNRFIRVGSTELQTNRQTFICSTAKFINLRQNILQGRDDLVILASDSVTVNVRRGNRETFGSWFRRRASVHWAGGDASRLKRQLTDSGWKLFILQTGCNSMSLFVKTGKRMSPSICSSLLSVFALRHFSDPLYVTRVNMIM